MNFQKAMVIGTGMMGPGIAVSLALGGVEATVVSRTQEGAAKGLGSCHTALDILLANGLISKEQEEAGRSLVHCSDQFDETVRSVDLVVESAPENLPFKQDLFAHMDSIAKPEAVLASNTSALSITAIAERCQRPERVLTTHFWNPPHLMPLVEIVMGAKTSPEVAESVKELLRRCGKMPVMVKKDRPGQLGNRLQMALVREAANIVQEGIASVEDVDLAAKSGFGLRLPVYGILEHQDAVGLDMGLHIVDYVTPDLNNEPRAPELMRQLVEQGSVGAKAGKGFYDWNSRGVSIDDVKRRRDEFLLFVMQSKFAPRPQS